MLVEAWILTSENPVVGIDQTSNMKSLPRHSQAAVHQDVPLTSADNTPAAMRYLTFSPSLELLLPTMFLGGCH